MAVTDTDTIVIGAGPVGLFQVFQLGLLGMDTHVIDVLPEAGGQCVALYPDKPIYDVPGVPACTGRELAQLLLTQAKPFWQPRDPATGQIGNLHLNDQVASVTPRPEGGFEIGTRQGRQFRCRAVFVAAGAGAFVPRALNVPALEGTTNLHYNLPDQLDQASSPWAGQHLVVAGGGDEALSAVAALMDAPTASRPASLTVLHRRDQFQGDDPALEARLRHWIALGQVKLALGLPSGADVHEGRATALHILGPDGATVALPLDHLLVRLGLSPKLGPLTDWGLRLDRKQVAVAPDSFQSSVPGMYAVGDINTYPGKKRLLLCGFHEATLAAHHALALLRPDQPQHLQYTTTSALLHQRLGLATPSS